MPDSLATMLASFNDNTSGDISAADGRGIIQALYDWIPPEQKYRMGRLPGETAHADDDFFTAYSGYTEQTPTGSATWAAGRSGLTVAWNSVGAEDMAFTVKAIPAAGVPITIETSFVAEMTNNANPGLGLVFTDGTGSGANVAGAGIVMTGGNPQMFRFSGTAGSYGAAGHSPSATEIPHFLRLTWISSNLFGWSISPDGETWTDWSAADFAKTITPTHMGLFVISNNASEPQTALFHYLRVYEADLSV